MRTRRMIRWIGIFCFFLLVPHFDAPACPPLPVLLYPVDEVYAENGWEIPDLPDDAIAVIDGTYLMKSDYKQWLYRKIGFEPELKKTFLMRRRLQSILEDRGIELEKEFQRILDYFFRFEAHGVLYESTEAWHEQNMLIEGLREPETYRDETGERVRESYLEVLYLVENWDDIHANVLEAMHVEYGVLSVSGDDSDLQHVLRLLNAYFVSQRLEAWIKPYIEKQVLADQNLNIPELTDEYIEWLYENHNTKFLVENYLGMVVSGRYAEANDLEISEEVVQEVFPVRVREYEELVADFNRRLPASAVPLDVSPVYLDYIMEEVRDDLYKSRAHRRVNPLRSYELIQRFYDQYGYNGKRSEVREIFKWVRRRRDGGDASGYADYVAAEEKRIRRELNALRDQILAEGVEYFPVYAMSANRSTRLQQTGGLVDMFDLFGAPEGRWGDVRDYTEKLEKLALHEVSPVMKGPWNTLDIFWLAETRGDERVYHMITRELPPVAGFDYAGYYRDFEAARKDLQELKELIEQGALIEKLAEEHSDSFRLHGADISDTYQEVYGLHFAKQIAEIPEGGLGIVQTGEGLHLVQVVSRTVTPLTDDIRAEILKEYTEELANQDDRYALTTLQLFQANPYFRTNQ